MYQLGISRNAQPIERLKRNFLAAKRRWEETELVENNEDTNIITTGRELLKDIYSGENSSSENQNIAKPINSQHAKLKV